MATGARWSVARTWGVPMRRGGRFPRWEARPAGARASGVSWRGVTDPARGAGQDGTADGREYIDGLAGVFTVSLGHGNRAIIDAITEQLNTLAFAAPLHGTNPQAMELAKVLLDFAPPGFGAVKFV